MRRATERGAQSFMSTHPTAERFNAALLNGPGLQCLVDERHAAALAARVHETGECLLDLLVSEHGVARDVVVATLARSAGLGHWREAIRMDAKFPLAVARRYRCVGMVHGDVRTPAAWRLVFGVPPEAAVLDRASLELEATVEAVLGDPADVNRELERAGVRTGETAPLRATVIPTMVMESAAGRFEKGGLEAALLRAARAGASDIHVERSGDGVRVRCRIAGHMEALAYDGATTTADSVAALMRLKARAGLDTSALRLPQDGRLTLGAGAEAVTFRVALMGSVAGEGMVLRVLRSSLPESALPRSADFDAFAALNAGAVIIAGPTGSGKTTTMNALTTRLVERSLKVLSVEDPVERVIPGAVQVAVDPAVGLGFGTALRAFLRHDPDVIAVGEIRDRETAIMALQAALTGHLVLATVHVGGIEAIPRRLQDLGCEPFVVAAGLAGMVAQRLMRRVCGSCAGSGRDRARQGLCLDCGGSGCSGVLAVCETARVTGAVRAALVEGEGNRAALAHALEQAGVVRLVERARAEVAAGRVPQSEFERVFGCGLAGPFKRA